MPTPVMLVIVIENHDVVSEKFCWIAPCMSNERLFLRKRQMKLFLEECSYLLFDFFGFFTWSTDYVSSKVKPL
jgi:hypothetical protein